MRVAYEGAGAGTGKIVVNRTRRGASTSAAEQGGPLQSGAERACLVCCVGLTPGQPALDRRFDEFVQQITAETKIDGYPAPRSGRHRDADEICFPSRS